MNADRAPTATANPHPLTAPGRVPVSAATSADAEGIIRMRSAHVLSAPLDEEWIGRSADELAPRLAPGGDARAFVVDTPDSSMAACALVLQRCLS
ncbi:hypothetical protein [Streptomyces sp. SAS_275]|uniref:hypothetical protein n=1 Tax=Streptomyces sp. SAS_275 TaxID=3412746 RepID=UPI00403C0281